MQILDKNFELFISSEAILKRIMELGEQLSKDYEEKNPVLVVILNGAFMFASDLIKYISTPCQVSFIRIASYQGVQSSGKVREVFGLEESIENRHLILLDDIIDTGLTMDSVMKELYDKKPASIETAALLLKPEAFGNQFEPKYIGFTIPNNFVVGYGLDYNGYGRNLRDLHKLKS